MPDSTSQYALLDFGDGRKLERFGDRILDRPSPVADRIRKSKPALWRQADARFQRTGPERGTWILARDLTKTWHVAFHSMRFELQLSPFGHIGIFPEQRACWQWIRGQVERAGRPLRVLNLFAYTGGSTLAAALSGAAVTHLDAAKTSVARARRNAAHSCLKSRPIRWIVDDARQFCRREIRRGRHYDAVILDPPSYGHGPRGETWRIGRDLLILLKMCGELTDRQPAFVLATCHTPALGPAELAAAVADGVLQHCATVPKCRTMVLSTADGRRLPAGLWARWPK